MSHIGNILVVSTDPVTHKRCRDILDPEGYSVLLAGSVMDGERMIEREKIDLVVLDWSAAGAPGDKAAEGIRVASEGTPPPIIVLLEGDDPEATTAVLRAGCQAFMFKPVSAFELKLRTRRIMHWDDELIPMGDEDLWAVDSDPGED